MYFNLAINSYYVSGSQLLEYSKCIKSKKCKIALKQLLKSSKCNFKNVIYLGASCWNLANVIPT